MSDFSKPELVPHPANDKNWRIYRGNSMLRVFVPGDLLIVETAAAKKLRRGDVVCFDAPNGSLTVHRVIGRSADGGIVTMGDNNPRPDPDPLSPDAEVGIVRAVRKITGRETALRGGFAGMTAFRINRMRRFGAQLSRMAAGALRRINPFRIALKAPVRFGDEEVFFFRGIPVAKRGRAAREEWLSPWYRTFLRVDAKK